MTENNATATHAIGADESRESRLIALLVKANQNGKLELDEAAPGAPFLPPNLSGMKTRSHDPGSFNRIALFRSTY